MLTGSLPPISRRSTYIQALEVLDDETGEPIDLTGATITVEIYGDGAGRDYGHESRRPFLRATQASSVTTPEPGIIVWRFEATAIGALCRGLVDLSVMISRDGDTREVARLSLPVED